MWLIFIAEFFGVSLSFAWSECLICLTLVPALVLWGRKIPGGEGDPQGGRRADEGERGAGAGWEGQGRGLRKVWPLVFSWLPCNSPSTPAGASHVWFIREKKGKGLSSMLGPTPGGGKGTAANVVLRMGTPRWPGGVGCSAMPTSQGGSRMCAWPVRILPGEEDPRDSADSPPTPPVVDLPGGRVCWRGPLPKLKPLPFSKGLLPFLYPGQHVVYPSPQPSPKVVAVLSQLSKELREPQILTRFQPTPQHC